MPPRAAKRARVESYSAPEPSTNAQEPSSSSGAGVSSSNNAHNAAPGAESSRARKGKRKALDQVSGPSEGMKPGADLSADGQTLRFSHDVVAQPGFCRKYDDLILNQLPDEGLIRSAGAYASQFYSLRKMLSKPDEARQKGQQPQADLKPAKGGSSQEGGNRGQAGLTSEEMRRRRNRQYRERVKAKRDALSPAQRKIEREAQARYVQTNVRLNALRKRITALENAPNSSNDPESGSTKEEIETALAEVVRLKEDMKEIRKEINAVFENLTPSVSAKAFTLDSQDTSLLEGLDSSALVALAIYLEECTKAHVPVHTASGKLRSDLIAFSATTDDWAFAKQVREGLLADSMRDAIQTGRTQDEV